MKLKDFIEKFVCANSLIRLWIPFEHDKKMLQENGEEVCMEWEVLKGRVWQSKYMHCEVIGVTDIVVGGSYPEAINIVINI